MKNILIINASANLHDSFSRKLSGNFADSLKNELPNIQINYRELGDGPIPHINQRWIQADRKPADSRTAEDMEILKTSNTLIEELKSTDIIVLATPMYNFSIPSSLKAYLDHIMRFNETFTLASPGGTKPYRGLLENKKLFLCLSRGGTDYEKGERNEFMDFQSGYLTMLFGIMGLDKITEFSLNGTARNNEDLERELIQLQGQITELISVELSNASAKKV